MTTFKIRVNNLRKLIDQWGGPTTLAKKLNHANGSFISQLAGPNPIRPVSEYTARKIEKQLNLPAGWLDQWHNGESTAKKQILAEVDTNRLAMCVTVVYSVIKQDARPAPDTFGELVSLVYASGLTGDKLLEYADRLAHLAIK